MEKHPIIGVISARHDMGVILPVYGTTGHYLEQIRAAGGVPLQLPFMPGSEPETLAALVSSCDGFLLPGGGDFSPQWYGQTLLPGLKPDPFSVDLESQETALALVRTMAASGKPMLCICLGMQVLTIALGGDLYQDIPMQIPSEIAHAKPINTLEERWRILHCVQTAEGSLIRRLTGAGQCHQLKRNQILFKFCENLEDLCFFTLVSERLGRTGTTAFIKRFLISRNSRSRFMIDGVANISMTVLFNSDMVMVMFIW